MKPTEIELHSGHALHVSGANSLINEVTEARRVGKRIFEILKSNNVPVTYFEDNTSKTQKQNLNTLVNHHNKDKNGLVVSIHFNSSGGVTTSGIGTEVLYYDQKGLAEDLSNAIAKASGLKNRGAKKRTDLAVLARTYEPAVLPEICFVNSKKDVELYQKNFEAICFAIAEVLANYIGYKLNNNTKESGISVSEYQDLLERIESLQKQLDGKLTKPAPREVSGSHKEAWQWMTNQGMTNGSNPQDYLSREQFSTMIKNYHENVGMKILSSTGRAMSKKVIEKAVEEGIFQETHLEKLDDYSDVALVSYVITYVYNKL